MALEGGQRAPRQSRDERGQEEGGVVSKSRTSTAPLCGVHGTGHLDGSWREVSFGGFEKEEIPEEFEAGAQTGAWAPTFMATLFIHESHRQKRPGCPPTGEGHPSVAHRGDTVSLSHKGKQITGTCYNVDGPQSNDTWWEKPVTEGHVSRVSTGVKHPE